MIHCIRVDVNFNGDVIGRISNDPKIKSIFMLTQSDVLTNEQKKEEKKNGTKIKIGMSAEKKILSGSTLEPNEMKKKTLMQAITITCCEWKRRETKRTRK